MKIKFKSQPYQTAAVEAVVDCFEGQPNTAAQVYRIDPGVRAQMRADEDGFRNADIALPASQVLENIRKVQQRQNLPLSTSLSTFVDDKGKPKQASYKAGAAINLDIEMETGTGKTYCYIKSIFEMNKRYGWSKFIIMVPSIAIREGVAKSLEMTAEHFVESYGKKARFFIYNSKRLHELESFSSDAGINVMVINVQAFNASGADNRRIYEELDDFQSRRPIDVIAKNRPILILDEPQKMEGTATQNALPKFNPLFILRYSATHKTVHNKVHRLDAVDAFSQKLVKKIEVRGIQAKGLTGTNAYLYLEGIQISKSDPVARVEMEVKMASGQIKRLPRKVEKGRNLFDLSKGLDQYRDFVVSDIDARVDEVHFTNGAVLKAGEASGDITERDIRRIQIRETIAAHFDREKQLFAKGIKVLSLFFIDEVAKYRDYDAEDEKGEYARVFEEEYEALKAEYLGELPLEDEAYRKHLDSIDVGATHNGYFSIDKKGKLVDPKVKARGEFAGLTDDVSAYDLILKDKERLLSFEEPTRFIFSHSALREGWDNPNVFVMCMLKHSDNTISRRQEVGRGLRISVNKNGDRMDHAATVHDINVLTVVASESYKDFVGGLQKEIAENLSERPRQANAEYFEGKSITVNGSETTVSKDMAKRIERYLIKNDYIDDNDGITQAYHDAREAGTLAALPDELLDQQEQILQLIDTVFNGSQLENMMGDARKPKAIPRNKNFEKKEFQELWRRINRKAVYQVEFDSQDLIKRCINALDSNLFVSPLQYVVTEGKLSDELTEAQLRTGAAFKQSGIRSEESSSAHSLVSYDVIGKLAEGADLTRGTIGKILTGMSAAKFSTFQANPEQFISEASRIIKEQKATTVIEHLTYDATTDRYDTDIFPATQSGTDLTQAAGKLRNHIYDYAVVDSGVERKFVEDLDTSDEIVVYSKLPQGFLIPTPVGDYNPDWAIAFKEQSVQHIYFVAETKGSQPSLKFRELEREKIKCARKFFEEIANSVPNDRVKYDVVSDFSELMSAVRGT
ncbi:MULTISPECIES: type III restriction-modification system endonuclease [unclassified Phaeobacter]|uniref:type III restriction-modification system endonuclease n=1 Tax=unclassified Phaeobacter TaxID=2621772 RepID=UPI003A8ABDCC